MQDNKMGCFFLKTLCGYKRNNTLHSSVAQIWQKFLRRSVIPDAYCAPVIRVVVVDESIEVAERASSIIDIGDACRPSTVATMQQLCVQ